MRSRFPFLRWCELILAAFLILEGKVGIISDRFYALVHRQVRVQLYPLAGIAHKGEMKTPVPGILYTSKFRLEAWLYWIWTSHAIFGTEVERLVVPFAVDIDDVVELRILGWWLDIFQLQNGLNEFIRLRGDFHFQRFWERRGRCFAWVHRPRIDFLWHPIPPCHADVPRVFLSMSMTSRKALAIAGLD